MEFKNVHFKDGSVSADSRTFEGYASTWDEDETGDIILPGAFKKSIAERLPKNDIKVLWQHYEPLGLPVEMREDDKGLYVKGRVSKTQLGDDALELMRDGAVDRMSIGFTIPKGKSFWDDDDRRIIHEVKLYEFSPVTFPANEMAVITGVKSLHHEAQRLKAKGMKITDSAEFRRMFTELKALFIDEPVESTQHEIEPLITEFKRELESLTNFIRG